MTREHDNLLLDALYGAAVGGGSWSGVLDAYAACVGAQGCVFHVYDLPTGTLYLTDHTGLPEDLMNRGRARWFAEDPWSKIGLAKVAQNPDLVKTGFVFQGAEELPYRDYTRTAYYNEFAKQMEVVDSLACAVIEGRFGLAMSAQSLGSSDRTFRPEHKAFAEQTLVHFRRAFRLHMQLARARETHSAFALFENTKLPVLWIRGSVIESANAAAVAAIASGDLIGAVGRRLTTFDTKLKEAMNALQGNPASKHAVMTATGCSGARWLVQLVRFNQLSGSILASVPLDDPALLVVLTPLDADAAGRLDVLESMRDLTPVERKIAAALANGQSVVDIARTRRLSIETVRWHVRNLIEKTGARNLADLQRILGLLLPF